MRKCKVSQACQRPRPAQLGRTCRPHIGGNRTCKPHSAVSSQRCRKGPRPSDPSCWGLRSRGEGDGPRARRATTRVLVCRAVRVPSGKLPEPRPAARPKSDGLSCRRRPPPSFAPPTLLQTVCDPFNLLGTVCQLHEVSSGLLPGSCLPRLLWSSLTRTAESGRSNQAEALAKSQNCSAARHRDARRMYRVRVPRELPKNRYAYPVRVVCVRGGDDWSFNIRSPVFFHPLTSSKDCQGGEDIAYR